jgi:hypothetical protein
VSIVIRVFEFIGSPVPVRDDLKRAYAGIWSHLAEPGPTLTGVQRVGIAAYVRAAQSGDTPEWTDLPSSLLALGTTLFSNPGRVDRSMVRSAADEVGDPCVVEIISIVSMLSAVDGSHRALGADLEPLPAPLEGKPTEEIAEGLTQRRTHVPMPSGAIPVALDLLPRVGMVFKSTFGPQYMTEHEMALDDFARTPGLDRAQIEIVSSRTSMHNKCFY